MDLAEFESAVSEFAESIRLLLDSCLPGETLFDDVVLSDTTLRASFKASKNLKIVPAKNTNRALLSCQFRLGIDSTNEFLAVDMSSFKVEYKATKRFIPIVRFEYEKNARNKPSAHFQFHADSVPLGLLLAQAGRHDTAAQQQDVHFPMGGHRFRVCLEDIVELVIREFKAESIEGWERHVENGRRVFREKQEETIIKRRLPKAIEILENLGYVIEPPTGIEIVEAQTSTEW